MMNYMKRYRIIYSIVLVCIFFSFNGCGLDAVENPNVTTDKFIESPQAANTWVNGARVEMANGLGVIVELTELTSDNYFNNRTLSSKVFDIPQIVFTDLDVDRLNSAVQEMRRTAEFGLETVLPGDPASTDELEAELRFYLGVAHLFSAEYFTGLPGENNGPTMSPDEHFSKAITVFEDVIDLSNSSERINASRLALARIAWHQNNLTDLRNHTEAIIADESLLNYQIEYDGLNGVDNTFQFFIYNSSQDEFAPLPRLDFLDPKYFSEGGAGLDQRSISLFKSEEAYLMLAEAELVSGDIPAAKGRLIELLEEIIPNRLVYNVDDARETRSGGNRNDYPLDETYSVRFSPEAPAVDELVLSRQSGTVQVPGVSGTSVTVQQVNGLSEVEDLLEIILLMRQEIFLAEGRRVVDLGIKYPVSENEVRSNESVDVSDSATSAQIPPFIPLDARMDDFTNDEENQVITILINMNEVLVENRTSNFILPLW